MIIIHHIHISVFHLLPDVYIVLNGMSSSGDILEMMKPLH